jgi:hypothetical protein
MRIRKWRKMTWTLLVFNGLMLIWAISAGASASGTSTECLNDTVLGAETCNDAQDIGAGIAVVMIGVLWFVGFIVLSLIWFMTRPKEEKVVYVERAAPTDT